jgi:serine/threonine protein kinase
MNNILKFNQYGGKLVGQGTYGCVFRPMIPCKGSNERRRDYVSKVMTKEEARLEYKESKEINKIDPYGVFHILGPIMCDIDKKHHNEPGMNKCKPIRGVNKATIGILQYKNGGEDLDKFSETVTKDKEMTSEITKKLLKGLRPLFIGLDIMWKNKYVHSDIKPKNIVIKSKTMTCKYIDFGLFTKMDNLDNIDFMFNELYFPHPSELLYITLYNAKQLSPAQFNLGVNAVHNNVKKSKTYSSKFNNNNVFNGNIYDISFTPDKTAFYRNIMRTHTEEQFRQLLCEKIDVHSLGVSLLDLYSQVTGTQFNLKPSRKYNPIKHAFHSLILALIEPQFDQRPNGNQAYDLYMQSVWPLIQPTAARSGGGRGGKSSKSSLKPKKAKKAIPKKAAPKKAAKPQRECRVNTRTNRCSMKGTANPELCTLSNKNRCRKKTQKELKGQRPRSKRASPKKARPKRASPKKARPKRASPKKTTTATRCKGKTEAQCKTLPNCKYTKGKKRQFCRKSHNKRRNKGHGGSGGGGRK